MKKITAARAIHDLLTAYPKLTDYLEAHFESVMAVLHVPESHRKRLRTTNHVGGSSSANRVSRSGALRRDSWSA